MLFCSYEFVFLFLPVVLAGYFLIGRFAPGAWARVWLVLASLVFYGLFKAQGMWLYKYLWVILLSIAVNYACVYALERLDWPQGRRRALMWFGIVFNLALLGWFKYAMFVLENLNDAFGTNFTLYKIILPLGISFFTFQQITCLVDLCKNRDSPRYSLLNYSLFVTFFPQLAMGPIVHHHDMMPQFAKPENGKLNFPNLCAGLHVFAIGVFKKLIIADFFGVWAHNGMDTWAKLPELTFWQALFSMFAYLFQIYFDFSAYSDMAVGVGRMFNIHLPHNFNSPLRACGVQDFWKRWHITLGDFLMKYVYFPLGGSRKGEARTYLNLFVVFLLCGVWHGATWPFVLFGALHGIGIMANRFWSNLGFMMPRLLAWPLTFFFVALTSTLVRCEKLEHVFRVWRPVFFPSDFNLASLDVITRPVDWPWLYMAGAVVLVLCFKNAAARGKDFKPTFANGLATVALLAIAVLHMQRITPFLYFNFYPMKKIANKKIEGERSTDIPVRAFEGRTDIPVRSCRRHGQECPCSLRAARWFACVISAFLATLLLAASIVLAVNPYQLYGVSLLKPAYINAHAYQMLPGLLRREQYDTVVVGSCMAQNFRISDMESVPGWGRVIKATGAGASTRTMNRFMNAALATGKARHVFLLPDTPFSAGGGIFNLEDQILEYLFDDNPWNDYQYFLNWDVLTEAVPRTLKANLGAKKFAHTLDRDRMFAWDYDGRAKRYGEDAVKEGFKQYGHALETIRGQSEKQAAHFQGTFGEFFLAPIRENQDIKFTVCFAPYSSVFWHAVRAHNGLDDFLAARQNILLQLLALPNVELHDVQGDPVAADLSRFSDPWHHNAVFSAWIIETIKQGNHRLRDEADIEASINAIRGISEPARQPAWLIEMLSIERVSE